MLAFAAVLRREFDVAEVRAGWPAEVDGPIQEAIEHHFVEEVTAIDADGETAGRLRFCHALVHEALYEEIPRHERERLHAHAAEAIERVRGHDLGAHVERLARHWRQATGPASSRRARDYTLRASRRTAALLAWEEAARLLRLVVELDNRAPERLLELGDLLAQSGDSAGAGESYLEALAAAEHSRPDVFIGAVLDLGEAMAYLAARLRTSTMRCRCSRGRWRIARRVGDPALHARVLGARLLATWRPDDPRESFALSSELLALAEPVDAPEIAGAGHRGRCAAALELGLADVARGRHAQVSRSWRAAPGRVIRVGVKVRTWSFFTPTREAKLPDGPTTDPDVIAHMALTVLGKFELTRPVRLLGVRADLQLDE